MRMRATDARPANLDEREAHQWPIRHEPIRVAFVASSGGSVIDAIAQAANERWPVRITGVLTDRPCGADLVATRWSLPQTRLPQQPWDTWSARAAEILRGWQAEVIVLLFLRKIGPEIWRDLPGVLAWNLHPSLLPAYRGLGALERNFEDALAAHAKRQKIMMGTTLHEVTDELDAGPIIARKSFTIHQAPTLDRARHVSFLHKVTLLLEQTSAMTGLHRDSAGPVRRHAQPWALPLLHSPGEAA
jgi:phosphoribosylglycinamide formyltransferase-1